MGSQQPTNKDKIEDKIRQQILQKEEMAYSALDTEPGKRIIQSSSAKSAFQKILAFVFRLN